LLGSPSASMACVAMGMSHPLLISEGVAAPLAT
jgi:hypothetical protein